MSISLVSYPVTINSGIINNIVPGFQNIFIEFKREDIAVVSISQGTNNTIVVEIAGDLSSSILVGDWVYLYSQGSTYLYDLSAEVLEVTVPGNTNVRIDSQFIEASTGGYLNYKQNWFLESKLVNPDNNNILEYPSLFANDGNANGEIKVSVSPLVDALSSQILSNSGEITEARNIAQLMYREVWREDDTQVFVLLAETPIIVTYSADSQGAEKFINDFDLPVYWAGYPFSIMFHHSKQNYVGKSLIVDYDELDINNDLISSDNSLVNFSSSEYGFLQVNFTDNLNAISDNTKFLKININESSLADFKAGDFKAGDFKTT
jgi:hypothetical protein